ncbi:PTS sugar transporter subunit IIA [Escherichia coli]
MPHARPELGHLRHVLRHYLNKVFIFRGMTNQLNYSSGLAADADSHIGAIQALSELLCEEEILEQLLTASSEKQLADIISRG